MGEQIELANSLLTLLERVENLGARGTISKEMADDAKRIINEQLAVIFPPEPPE